MADTQVAMMSHAPATPSREGPAQNQRRITLQQKQALIDNLQLELTERARRLRAQYNLQAQGLKSRIEIRINRIPQSLRRMKMGDLYNKYLEQEEKRSRPLVPAKNFPRLSPVKQARPGAPTPKAGRGQKRMSDAISGDKENDAEQIENAKKRVRAAQPDAGPVHLSQILSQTSSNSRMNRDMSMVSPSKSQARPMSPFKQGMSSRPTPSSTFSSMTEKMKGARPTVAKKTTTTTATPNFSSSVNGASNATKKMAPTASRAPTSRPGTRTGRRASANSESSEASTGTVLKKSTTKPPPAIKKSVINSIRKGVAATTTKKTAAKAGSASSSQGRALRKRA